MPAVGVVVRAIPREHGRDLLALASGAALPLAFAPFGWYPLAVVAPALLFIAWGGASARRVLWRGWLFGLGMFGVGVSWVHESFQFSAVGPPLSVVLTVGLVGLLALYPALTGAVDGSLGHSRMSTAARTRVRLLLVLPAAWVLVEWFRGWFLTGFTWLQLGYSQVDAPLGALLPVVGVYGVGAAVAVSAGLAALAVGERGRARVGWVSALAALWLGAGALAGVHWTAAAGEPLRVALIQGNLSQDIKWLPEQREPTLERYLGLTRAHWQADVVVWPETALPGFYAEFRPFLERLTGEARAHDTDLLIGVPMRAPHTERYYNSVVALGGRPSAYHKRHLVPFGEYLPLRPVLGGVVDLLAIPMSDFSPGPQRQPLLEVAGYPVGVSVCYEAAFASEVMEALPQARLLVNVSNDAWFGDSLAPHQNLEIARARARESGRPLLRATNTGISAVIGPLGTVEARAPQFQAAVVTHEVTPMGGRTPYVRFGDYPTLIGAVLALAAGVLLLRRPWRRGRQAKR